MFADSIDFIQIYCSCLQMGSGGGKKLVIFCGHHNCMTPYFLKKECFQVKLYFVASLFFNKHI